MKKTVLLILAAGALVFNTLPVNAQQSTTTQQVQKEKPKTQGTQAAANPAGQAKATKTAARATAPAASKPSTAVTTATPPPPVAAVVAPANPAAANQVVPPAPPVPLTCTWDVVDYDFGKNVIHQKPASATYTMTNAGKDPVTITQVSTSCGCTAPKYTKEPIKPGEKGEVVLTYNAAISGFFSKSAQVTLNDGQKYSLTIKGEVQKVEPEPAPAPVAVPPVIK
jgi:hypothetical protein